MTLERIVQIIAENRGIDAETIKAETTFAELGLDSLDTVELVMSLEDEFGISIEVNEGMKTVADVVALIDSAE